MFDRWRALGLAAVLGSTLFAGCVHNRTSLWNRCNSEDCEEECEVDGCRHGYGAMCHVCAHRRSGAIPDTLPLGSTVRSHYQVMQTNGEAMDFILHQHEFIGETAQLTSDGKDHVLEIAARMRSAPFPVVIERTWNNADPELDAHRRDLVAQILTDLGNPDAQQRTVVATPYGPGYNSIQAEPMYYQHVVPRGGLGFGYGSYGNTFGTYGGFGGGAGGAIGFGP